MLTPPSWITGEFYWKHLFIAWQSKNTPENYRKISMKLHISPLSPPGESVIRWQHLLWLWCIIFPLPKHRRHIRCKTFRAINLRSVLCKQFAIIAYCYEWDRDFMNEIVEIEVKIRVHMGSFHSRDCASRCCQISGEPRVATSGIIVTTLRWLSIRSRKQPTLTTKGWGNDRLVCWEVEAVSRLIQFFTDLPNVWTRFRAQAWPKCRQHKKWFKRL